MGKAIYTLSPQAVPNKPVINPAHCRYFKEKKCRVCEKVCPVGAIETRMPYQLGYHKAQLIPMMGTDTITWTCVDIHGNVERFRYRNRTEPE